MLLVRRTPGALLVVSRLARPHVLALLASGSMRALPRAAVARVLAAALLIEPP